MKFIQCDDGEYVNPKHVISFQVAGDGSIELWTLNDQSFSITPPDRVKAALAVIEASP